MMSVLKFVISRCKTEVVVLVRINYRFIISHRLVNVLIYITAKKLYPMTIWILKLETILIMCIVGQIRARC